MIAAFGTFAQQYVRGLGDLEAIVTELPHIGEAYLEAVRHRERGETFYGMVLFDEPHATCTNRYAHQVLTSVADYDLQLLSMGQLASGNALIDGQPASEHWKIDFPSLLALGDFYRLCDVMLVRSYAEYGRITQLFEPHLRPLRPVERVLVEAQLPASERRRPERPGVVVWSPRRPAMEAALHGFALREFRGDVLCVTAGGALPNLPAERFATPGDPRVTAALATAACIVCADPSDPGDAVAFARRGYGVVAPFTAGAHEFCAEVVPWDGSAMHLPTCVAIALARPAMLRSAVDPLPPAPLVPPLPPGEPPLVSVVCPTYNRPEDLAHFLDCIATQSYPNLECIIVNDAGSPVAQLVGAYRFARLIDLPENRGGTAAMEIGWHAARGEYIQLMADDDLLYPDHLTRMIGAMLRSGALVAHGVGLSRTVERTGGGAWRTTGLSCVPFFGTPTPTEALIAVPMYYHQLAQHRRTLEEVGWLRADMSLSDQEMLLRLAQRYTFAWADYVTSEFRDHQGGAGKRFDHLAEQRRIYDELHPVGDRPVIAKRRATALEGVARRVPGQPAFAPVLQVRG